MKSPNKSKEGFTLLESLIVLGILSVMIGSGYALGIQQYNAYTLRAETENITSILSMARSRAMNNINDSNHGVYFDSKVYVVFQGDAYESRDEDYDERVHKSTNIKITGPEQVVFNNLRGDISTGEAVIAVSAGASNKEIELNNEGRINR